MKGQAFLTLAQQLVQGPMEADWRSAVSRAYYAAFHVARDLLGSLGFRVPRADRAHIYLSRRLENAGDPQVQLAGSDLHALRGDRNEADYDLHRPLSQAAATLQVRIAERVIQAFDAAQHQPVRTQITDAMKKYERDVLQEVTWHP